MQNVGIHWRALATLAGGHVWTDVNQGAVPALLPFLISEQKLSYGAASALVLAATFSSSVLQPAFGYYSDRHPLPWLIPGGVFLGALGIGLVGFAPGYPWLFLSIVLSGLGVAAFHPEAARFANYVSGGRRASGMSFFALGGNIGFAMGPLLVTGFLSLSGLRGTLWVLLPATIMVLILVKELPHLSSFRSRLTSTREPGVRVVNQQPARWGAFSLLTAVIAFRSFAYFGLLTFVPLYASATLRLTKTDANAILTIMLFVGAGGTLLAGWLADRIERKFVIVGSLALAAPCVLGFTLLGNIPLALVCVVLAGTTVIAPFNVTVVMGQEYLPNNLGVAAGVTMGLGIGVGGLGTTLLGLLADQQGLRVVLLVIALLPLSGAGLALLLPRRSAARVLVNKAAVVGEGE